MITAQPVRTTTARALITKLDAVRSCLDQIRKGLREFDRHELATLVFNAEGDLASVAGKLSVPS